MRRASLRSHSPFGSSSLSLASRSLGLVFLVVGIAAGQEEASRLPQRLVFEAYENGNWELFTIRSDGTDRVNLTATTDRHELYPQVSPDGRFIAFLCDEERDGKTVRSVERMAIDGSGRIRIEEAVREPAWSPDGRSILFAKQEFERFDIADYVSKGLRVHDVETGTTRDAKNETIHHIYNPNVSPDGRWLVTTVHGGMGFRHGIIAVEIDGERVMDLKIPGCRPSLSADGSRIAWSSDDHTISVAELTWSDDGPRLSNPRVVHHEETLHTYHPDLTPDGTHVVFSLGPGGRVLADGPGTHTQVAEMIGVKGRWNLVVRRIDSDQPLRFLTTGEDATSKEADWIPDSNR